MRLASCGYHPDAVGKRIRDIDVTCRIQDESRSCANNVDCGSIAGTHPGSLNPEISCCRADVGEPAQRNSRKSNAGVERSRGVNGDGGKAGALREDATSMPKVVPDTFEPSRTPSFAAHGAQCSAGLPLMF